MRSGASHHITSRAVSHITPRAMANSCPTTQNSSETQNFSFSGLKDVPIRSVVVYTKDKAEITRVLNFDKATTLGLHEVRLSVILGPYSHCRVMFSLDNCIVVFM